MGIEPTTRSLGNFGRLGPITPLLGSNLFKSVTKHKRHERGTICGVLDGGPERASRFGTGVMAKVTNQVSISTATIGNNAKELNFS